MRALRLHGVGDVRLADEPTPVPGPDEALVRVTAVGICGSDLHWYDETGIGDAVLARPLVLGHEAAGVVESVSQEIVEDLGDELGDVGRDGKVAGGFGTGAPMAEEIEDGTEELIFGGRRRGRTGCRRLIVTGLEIVEIFNGPEEELQCGEVDFG